MTPSRCVGIDQCPRVCLSNECKRVLHRALLESMVRKHWDPGSGYGMQGKKVAVSGAGNVAIYTAEKLLEFGATVLTMSDSSGYVYFEKGITREQLTAVDTHKVANRGRLADFKEGEFLLWDHFSVPFRGEPSLVCPG